MTDSTKILNSNTDKSSNNMHLQEFPLYPVQEDMYSHSQKDDNIDLDSISCKEDLLTNKLIAADAVSNSLDIPGAELDDAQENIGSEDEENNYYSLGGDEHNNLDEDNGE